MTIEPYDESVHDAVAREAARRKRVLLAFMGLLLVPMAIGAYALAGASTEKEQLATDVTPIVAQRVGNEIASSVTNDVVARTQPLIQQNVSRQIAEVVEPRISSVAGALRSDITTLQTSMTAVPALETRVAALGGLVERNANALNAGQERLRQEIAQQREVTQRLLQRNAPAPNTSDEAIASLTRQVAVLQREVKQLQTRVAAIEGRPTQRVPQ
ncbi:MAG TPA: hypothetical protein VE974_18750 [Thermoanaerobaculia bacterium]|nr:hypothetical protein [Thermoanaerobaculia bacterium]